MLRCFQMAMQELERRADEYFKWKEKQFDKYVDRKIEEKYGTITKED